MAARSRSFAALAPRLEPLIIPFGALLGGLLAFSIFLMVLGKSPVDFFSLVYKAGFGTSFSWQNTLSRVAPLLLTGGSILIFAAIHRPIQDAFRNNRNTAPEPPSASGNTARGQTSAVALPPEQD